MYQYTATILGVHDGDTVTARIELGFDVSCFLRFRLAGIQAPELTGKTADAGKAARDFLRAILDGNGNVATIRTQRDKQEKYGRYLAEIWAGTDMSNPSVNQQLVASGHAVRWDGKGPRPD